MASKQSFHKGDRVEWSSGQGKATGIVQAFVQEPREVEGKTVAASKDDPRYLIKNDHTGNVTSHRPDSLSKADSAADAASSKSSDSSESSESSERFEQGDRVAWNTRQGKTTGTVQNKLTSETDIKGHTAKATEDEPQYLVESESTGSKAAHKPDALEQIE
ncbi:MAG: Protein of unknown function (DUF2945) [Phormidesmis priestleyi Ana]|uniref:Hypervirulence associated protein TUDOR domain-containing protein n=1 Tax=Phormidesmis priestleyi Ana TaxID=1666911 RepID=A0A0P7YWG8_9CYAN|nr:MAG: Protein of unknown function (DUF2945) [Phormidesmis priestleyi Ana]